MCTQRNINQTYFKNGVYLFLQMNSSWSLIGGLAQEGQIHQSSGRWNNKGPEHGCGGDKGRGSGEIMRQRHRAEAGGG